MLIARAAAPMLRGLRGETSTTLSRAREPSVFVGGTVFDCVEDLRGARAPSGMSFYAGLWSRRIASSTPLTNDAESSVENCRANSSASSITIGAGESVSVIS